MILFSLNYIICFFLSILITTNNKMSYINSFNKKFIDYI